MHGPREVGVARAFAHRVAQRHRATIGEARAQIALRRDAHAIARRTELVADRGDESDALARSVARREVAGRPLAAVARALAAIDARTERDRDLIGGEETLLRKRRRFADRHQL